MESYLQQVLPPFVALCGQTGAAVTLYDGEGNVLAHCGGGADLCRYMHQNEALAEECNTCDQNARKRLASGCDLFAYVCHAGLSEVAVAIRGEKEALDGYIIMGKFLTAEALEETKSSYRTLLSRNAIAPSALLSSYRALPGLKLGQVKGAHAFLLELAQTLREEGTMRGFRNQDILKIMQLVRACEGERVTCAGLYERLGVSRHTLEEIVAGCCGERPAVFLRQQTLIRAEDLLMNTCLAVDKIAEKLGYDLSSFIDLFRRLYGETPGKFRRFGVDRRTRFECALPARTGFRIPI